MNSIEGKPKGLSRAVEHIQEHGLPSVAEMRADLAERGKETFQAEIRTKLEAYKILFEKFTSGTATDEEVSALFQLSAEFDKLQKTLEQT